MPSVVLLIDRLLNSTSAGDVSSVLESLSDTFNAVLPTNSDEFSHQNQTSHTMATELIQSHPFMSAISSLLTSCTLPSPDLDSINPPPGIHVPEASTTTVAFLLSLLCPSGTLCWTHHQSQTLTTSLLKSSPITSSLLDMLYDPINVTNDTFARTSCATLMTKIHSLRPQAFESDVISTPNGLNRLVDLLSHDEEIVDESVRNEILLLLITLTKSSETTRKLVAFNEGFDRLFSIINHEGGLTGGSIVVNDCLVLANNLVEDDGAMLLLQSSTTLTSLPQLLDVNRGQEFLNFQSGKSILDADEDPTTRRLSMNLCVTRSFCS